ncbi:MAG: hypothetical protein R6U96_17500 [Promethearchaeia archaeon]
MQKVGGIFFILFTAFQYEVYIADQLFGITFEVGKVADWDLSYDPWGSGIRKLHLDKLIQMLNSENLISSELQRMKKRFWMRK